MPKIARDPTEHLQHAFVRDGRLTSLPTRRPMMLAACRFLAARFTLDRRYAEAEVNALLGDDAPDPATLRRLLVDEGFLRREAGVYWRPPPAG
ncbi:MAG TPA: DUF2087 domain-containing protein [Candidatus Limnocylindrales bacterium]|jgi:hypothetical protein|nr:DUF2087 domain-containing protein [Candidatus Limnocylindrales bacterium]